MTKTRRERKNTCLDYLIMGGIVVIGLAEMAHLAAVVFGWTFTRCAVMFWGLVGIGLFLCMGFSLFWRRRLAKNTEGNGVKRRLAGHGDMGASEYALFAVFALTVISQIAFICLGNAVYRQGDMMVETVGSFLASDGIYRVNPMTGSPYTEGIPSRLKILCLPTLYGSLCKVTGLSPRIMVWRIVPVATLLGSYAAFASLGRCLFPAQQTLTETVVLGELPSENKSLGCAGRCWDGKKLGCFMAAISLLLWAGTYGYGVEGFDLLFCGYRGVVIRNLILAPWLFSLCLRKKWFCAILCVLAEACMVWTLYGMGVCLVIAAGMAGIQLVYRLFSKKVGSGQSGKKL